MGLGMRLTKGHSGCKWIPSGESFTLREQAGRVIIAWGYWNTPEEIPYRSLPGGNIMSLFCVIIPVERGLMPLDIARRRPWGRDLICRFVPSPDNTQMWLVYHATPAPHDGWANRKAHCQPLELRCGLPYAGRHPLPEGRYPAPSGSFIPGQPTPLPETVMGPLPSRNDPDTKRMMEKGKKCWQSIKKGFS